MRMMRRLGREDWIAAGLQRLSAMGHARLGIEGVARELGVTKGSFYWHFRDRQDWCAALLDYWEHMAFARLVGPRRSVDPDWRALSAAVVTWAQSDVTAARTLARVSREAGSARLRQAA